MKFIDLRIIVLCAMFTSIAHGQGDAVPECVISNAMAQHEGSCVIIDCASGAESVFDPQAAKERLSPCSTFKIVNALIGLECGIIGDAEEAFWHWKGKVWPIPGWNKDLSLRDAFQASCVPAFQNLARQIGPDRMQKWVDRIAYGNRDTSAGIDVFWLPAKGRHTILISPMEQAQLMGRIVSGNVPFSKASQGVLKQLMLVKQSARGRLYGKTGSGTTAGGTKRLGWFVGYVESGGDTYAFACAIQGEKLMGADARAIVESIFHQQSML